MPRFRIKIDQLPEEPLEAADVRAAAAHVADLVRRHDSLRNLDDAEPVEIKRPDGTPWGRNVTLGDVRAGLFDAIDDATAEAGPQRPAVP